MISRRPMELPGGPLNSSCITLCHIKLQKASQKKYQVCRLVSPCPTHQNIQKPMESHYTYRTVQCNTGIFYSSYRVSQVKKFRTHYFFFTNYGDSCFVWSVSNKCTALQTLTPARPNQRLLNCPG